MTALAIAAGREWKREPSFFRQILDDWPQDKGDERHDDDDSDADQKHLHKLPFVVFRFLMTSLTNDTLADPNSVIFNELLAFWTNYCRPLALRELPSKVTGVVPPRANTPHRKCWLISFPG